MHPASPSNALHLAVLALLAGPVLAEVTPKWGSHFDVELKPGQHRSLMEGDLFVPVTQDADTLVFGDLRARFDDESAHEGNFGLGIRQMVNPDWILGGYGYYDRKTTGLGSEFEQMTLGLEALGRDWEFRTNLYVPFGSTTNTLGGSGGDPYLQFGTGILQVVTPSGQREERALGGFDAEVGYRLPLFDAEDGRQLRIYGGGFRFEDDITRVTGPRVRAEFVLEQVPGLWKGAQMTVGLEYQDDNARGSQSYASLRLRIPFGGRDNAPVLTAQERRMTAPTVRDVDIVSQAKTSGADKASVEDATQTADGRTLLGFTSEVTAGADLPTVVSNAGNNSVVLLSGTFNTTSVITLQQGQTLQGAGALQVRTASGQVLSVRTPQATIASGSSGAINMASNSTVRGLYISGGSYGISGGSLAGPRLIENNTVVGSGSFARGITISGVTGAVVVRNNNVSISISGIALDVQNSDNVLVAGNTFRSLGSIHVAVFTNNVGFAFGSTGNVNAGGDCSTTSNPSSGSVEFTDGSRCP